MNQSFQKGERVWEDRRIFLGGYEGQETRKEGTEAKMGWCKTYAGISWLLDELQSKVGIR